MSQPVPPMQPAPLPYVQKSRIAAGLLGIFLGLFGIHNFYLGRINLGLAQLLITVLSFGFLSGISAIWGFIEGILYLTARAPRWSTDARGMPLSN